MTTTIKNNQLIGSLKRYLKTKKIDLIKVTATQIYIRNDKNHCYEIDIVLKNDGNFWEEIEKFAEYVNTI